MSEKVTSTFSFYGNQAIHDLKNEIIKRFDEDLIIGNNAATSVLRILYGLDKKKLKDPVWANLENIGVHYCSYSQAKDELQIESSRVQPDELQNFITKHAAKLDPNVAVLMKYLGDSYDLVGTRITCLNEKGDIFAEVFEEVLEYQFCHDDEYEEKLAEIQSFGYGSRDLNTFEWLHEYIHDNGQFVLGTFNAYTNRNIQLEEFI
ncbi:hypothetical protein G6656_06740 [Polynucleobacter paneuropaeus]|jgi:hypothetical protein|nr:hypothetical protein [Polynucleobacter paneuropaeus]